MIELLPALTVSWFWLLLAGATPAPANDLAAFVRPEAVRPGGVFLMDLMGPASAANVAVGGHRFQFFLVKPGWLRAFAALPLDADSGEFPVVVDVHRDSGAHQTLEVIVHVPEVEFPETELKVARKFVHMTKAAKQQARADKAAIRRAYDVPFRPPRFEHAFSSPRPGAEKNSPFGERRVFNGELQSQHYGLDLDGKVGDPIYAANDGVVRLARECYTSGNTVILDHGADVFTSYFHMSVMKAKAGDVVKQGQLIGLVGKTGRVTGPHLHFSVRIGTRAADPETLLALTLQPPGAPPPTQPVAIVDGGASDASSPSAPESDAGTSLTDAGPDPLPPREARVRDGGATSAEAPGSDAPRPP
jgi:murein DD-endopeptidase MepM/ murein hydrolase activator NlpD